uniref:WAP domain-containing protein n=1 Tax=Sinocyclocheilus grahami TaxID=75366 RepID=A0A672L8E1_SINGR
TIQATSVVCGFFFCLFCMSAEPEKPGVCPRNNVEEALLGVCAEMCSHDSDCPDDQKCCSNGCGHQCMPPYKGIYNSVYSL